MTLKKILRATFDTKNIAPTDRFEVWRSVIGQAHDIGGPSEDFQGTVSSTALGPMIVSEMSSSPQTVSRSLQRAKRDGLDYVVLHLTSSDFNVESGDARFHVPAQTVTVNTLSRPFWRSASSEKNSVIVRLSREQVAAVLPDPEIFHGKQLRHGLGSLVRDHMITLATHAHLIKPEETEGLARATAQLLAAGLEPMRNKIRDAGAGIEAAAFIRCKRHIEARLASPDLGPDSICRDIGLSRSTLFRLFKNQGGISTYIRMRRLNAARNLLIARDRPRISDIAYQFGFTDAAAFSRTFKAAYGISPREAAEADLERTELNVFDAWMRAVAGE